MTRDIPKKLIILPNQSLGTQSEIEGFVKGLLCVENEQWALLKYVIYWQIEMIYPTNLLTDF